MDLDMKENLDKIILKAKEYIIGLMEEGMKELGKKTK